MLLIVRERQHYYGHETIAPINLISTDERGIAYIANTRMKVRQIAIEAEHFGYSPQEIQEAHEHLSLAQIHAALAYYYSHKEAIDAEIAQEEQEVEALLAEYGTPIDWRH
ncbi:MAG TPA: DUF433 domain-containing protein [Chthonomonadaceae bacterium]|nr:DUF433 domain-containing protein [Chthonomonadaceae bacterium]